uniref:Uncharacterized protein n=1 Tax=Heterorhabditis bacteriophora TaxID=37862 RepID=A0A1I7WBE3_HETBA
MPATIVPGLNSSRLNPISSIGNNVYLSKFTFLMIRIFAFLDIGHCQRNFLITKNASIEYIKNEKMNAETTNKVKYNYTYWRPYKPPPRSDSMTYFSNNAINLNDPKVDRSNRCGLFLVPIDFRCHF